MCNLVRYEWNEIQKIGCNFWFYEWILTKLHIYDPPSSPIIYIYIYFEKKLMFGRHSLTSLPRWRNGHVTLTRFSFGEWFKIFIKFIFNKYIFAHVSLPVEKEILIVNVQFGKYSLIKPKLVSNFLEFEPQRAGRELSNAHPTIINRLHLSCWMTGFEIKTFNCGYVIDSVHNNKL